MGFLEKLTDREKEIVRELALGYTEKEAASNLFVSHVTVHNHTYNMRKKTNSRSNLDLVVKFILSLDNPKQYFAALFFLVIQFGIIGYNQKEDVRRVPKNFKEARFTRLSRHNRKDIFKI